MSAETDKSYSGIVTPGYTRFICTDHNKTHKTPPKRRKISQFSKNSRRRLAQHLLSLASSPSHFLTLTYPGEWVRDANVWKMHLDRFAVCLQRKFPFSWFTWKLEPQERLAPHYHLLGSFGKTDFSRRELKQWLSKTWANIVGAQGVHFINHLKAGTRIDFLTTKQKKRQKLFYIFKYIGKLIEDVPEWANPGRFWGVINRKNVPPTVNIAFETRLEEFRQFRRIMRTYVRKSGKKGFEYAKLLKMRWSFFCFGDMQIFGKLLHYYKDAVKNLRLVMLKGSEVVNFRELSFDELLDLDQAIKA